MKIRRLHVSGIAFLFLIAIVFIAISYFHFRGIETSLERLVEQKTKGQYKLDLGETHYDFIRLDFILKDARVYRIDTLSKKRIYSVQLPYVKINLGSLESYFSFGQINIKEFLISEPFVELRKGEVERHHLQLSSELSRMLSIIKELLDSFNVHSFKISKGSFALNKEEHTVRIGLIDLLAQEWNVRKLAKESELRVNLGAQNLDILNHQVSFDQIEYSYLKRRLIISDFTYHHVDTLTGMNLDVKADDLIISHLDWKQLSLEERYKLKKVELIHPKVRGTFPLASKKKKALNPFRTFRDMVGELMIDSVLVKDADVDLAYVKLKDTTSVSFNRASFSVTAFKLLQSKETFEVGEVKFNLNKTELIIGKKYVLRFDSLSFNHFLRQRLYVEGFQFAERNSTKPLLTSRQVFVNRFNPFDFLMEKKINADALELNDVRVIVSPELLKNKNQSDKKENNLNVNLKKVQLSNATLEYVDNKQSAVAKNLNVRIRNVRISDNRSPLFDFDFLLAQELNYQEEGKLSIDVETISLNSQKLFTKAILVSQSKGLSFRLQNTSFNFDSFRQKIPDHFSSVSIEKFLLVGTPLSAERKQTLPKLILDRLTIDTVLVNVAVKESKINLHAFGFSITDVQMDSALFKWGPVISRIRDLSFENNQWKIASKNSKISTDSLSRLNQLTVFKKDSTLMIEATALEIPMVRDFNQLPELSLIRPRIKFRKNKLMLEGIVDSVKVKGIQLYKKEAEEIVVFHPVLQIILPERQLKNDRRRPSINLPDAIHKLDIMNADVTLKGRREPVYVYGADLNLKHGSLSFSLDSLHTNTRNDEIRIAGIDARPDELSISAISVLPLQTLEKYKTTGVERDYLKLNFADLKAKGFVLDSVLSRKGIQLKELSIGGFQIDVLRDKRLPDAPFKEKKLFSHKLYDVSRLIDIPSVQFKNGVVNIHQISEKTNETGELIINNIAGEIKNLNSKPEPDKKLQLNATTQIFGKGEVKVNYEIQDVDRFSLDVDATDLDFQTFNPMIQPLQSVRFKSGKLRHLKVNALADDSVATGEALINYTDLRIEITKADKTEFRNDFLSAVANEIIKNKRKDAVSPLVQEHDKGKAEFTYWAKILMKGASGAARHGKKKKKK